MAGRSISERSANYQFHTVAQFLAKLAPWMENGYNRSRYSDNQFKFKVGGGTLWKCSRECYSYRPPRPFALPQISRGDIRKGVGWTDADVKKCFFASGNSGAFVSGGILFPREHASEFLPLSGFLFGRN